MTAELKLPPSRPMPPEVRDRIRARVLEEIDPPRRFRNGRAPLAVAAGVAVLVAGAVIVGQSVSGGPGQPGDRQVPPTGTTSRAPLDLRKANAELDRCWAAIQAEGKKDRYSDRARWRAVETGDYGWVTITTAFVDGKPIFCQSTPTTVRVSEPTGTPQYVAGNQTAALFISPEGIIAGVKDPSWAGVETWLGDGSFSEGFSSDLSPYGLFVSALRTRVTDATRLEVDPWSNDRNRSEHPERFTLPRPAPLVSRVDRPAAPADRTSERGQWLRQCLDKSASPVLDVEMWQPGAWVASGESRYLVLRGGDAFAYCFTDKDPSTKDGVTHAQRWGFGKSSDRDRGMGKDRPSIIPGPSVLDTASGEMRFVTGALPDNATRLEITQSGHPPAQADIDNSTFAVLLPALPDSEDMVRAFDAAGNKIFEGTYGSMGDF